MTDSNDIIGNRTLDFLACSSVPQPTALPHYVLIIAVNDVLVMKQETFIYCHVTGTPGTDVIAH
jgi:hypothetical protein